MSASQDVSVPEPYKPYFEHMMQSMMYYPFAHADENQVAEQIYAAASDKSDRLRFLAGPDAEETARLRWSTTENTYMAAMQKLLGQTAWRNKQEI